MTMVKIFNRTLMVKISKSQSNKQKNHNLRERREYKKQILKNCNGRLSKRAQLKFQE